jgi:hypothetical protein
MVEYWHREVRMDYVRYRSSFREAGMKKIIILIFAYAFLGTALLGCGGGSSPVDTVKEFMTSLANDDYAHAYEMIPAVTKEGMSYEEFTDFAHPDKEVIEEMEYSLGEHTDSSATVILHLPFGGEVEVLLTLENDDWKVNLGDTQNSFNQ